MIKKETFEKKEPRFETQSPILMTLASNMSYEDAKLLSTYKKWRIIRDI